MTALWRNKVHSSKATFQRRISLPAASLC